MEVRLISTNDHRSISHPDVCHSDALQLVVRRPSHTIQMDQDLGLSCCVWSVVY